MEGGVIRIRFEADTSGIDEQLKQLEKAAENVSKISSTASKKASSETAKKAREEAKAERDKNKEIARAVRNKFSLEKELRAEEQANLKRSVSNSIALAKEAQKAEVQAEKQLQYEQKTRYAIKKRQEQEAARIARETAKAQRDQERAAAKAQRDQIYNLRKWAYAYYDIRNGLNLVKEGLSDIISATSSVVKAHVKWGLTLAKVVTPVTTLTANFLKTSGVLNKIKSAFSFNSILQFGKSSVEAASDLTEVQNIVETAFPNMTGQMNDWAKASINAFGLSEKSAKQYASTLGLMAQSAGLAEESSYKLGTSLTAVTADLASIYNMNASDVYEKIRSGVIGGRTAAIAQLGINMNQSNLQAYMESKGLSSKYTSLDNATKTIIRYNYVLEQTKKIQGDFVKTQGTWANQTRILAENMTALKAELGSFIVTVLTPALQVLNGILQVLTRAIAKIKEILPLLGFKIQSAASSSSISLDGYADGLDDVGDAADEAASKVAKLSDGPFSEMHKVADNAASSLGNIFGGADGLLEYENPYKSRLESLGKVEKFLERISKKLDLGELKIAGLGVLEEIVNWIDAIKRAWKDAWNKDDNGTKYLQSFVNMLTSILNVVHDISKAFRSMYENGWGELIFTKMLGLATKLNDTVTQIVERFRKFWNSGSGHYETVLTEQGKTNSHKLSPSEIAAGKKQDFSHRSYKQVALATGEQVNKADTTFRELSWGEYIAEQFYKAQVAILDCLDALLDFIQEVNKNIDWDTIFESWGETLNNFAKALNNLSDWLNKNPQIAQKLGEIFTWILANPGKIWLTITALSAFKTALLGIGKAFIGVKLTKAAWKTFFAKDVAAAAGSEAASSAGGGLITGIKSILGGAKAILTSPVTWLFAAVTELSVVGFRMINEIWTKVKEEGAKGLADIGFWLLEIPEKCRGPIASMFAKLGTLILQPGYNWIHENVAPLFDKAVELIGKFFEHFGEDWNTFWNTLQNEPEKVVTAITRTVDRIVDVIGKAISKLKEFIGLQNKVDDSKFTGTKGAAWVKTSGAQKAGYANIGNITKHAAGGVFTPNRPHLAVLGDHRSETEFALTEGHLDEIANRMAGAISAQMMRMSAVQNTRSGGNNTYIIQIGDEQIQDFIVKTVDENNYRR